MSHQPVRIRGARVRAVLLVCSSLSLANVLAAQMPCHDQGSSWVPAAVLAGPPLGCRSAPQWPAWHLLVPGHRQVVPKIGFMQGNARAVPQAIVTWRCTGFLLVPVVPDRVRSLGYVLDVAEQPCR